MLVEVYMGWYDIMVCAIIMMWYIKLNQIIKTHIKISFLIQNA